MKKVLVTGGLGFIGSNWINRFGDKYDIGVIDALRTGSNQSNISEKYEVITTDIADIKEHQFEDMNPDVVLNFAAETHVDRSIEDPLSFVKTNVLGTANLLNCVRNVKPECRFVHVSTDEVFGHLGTTDPKFNENTPYNPRSPYSASKASSDHIVRAYHETYGLDVVITNCCNNYGPRQHGEKLIPTIIKTALRGEDIPVYGDGTNVREWIYVDDHNDALTLVMENGKSGETYCIGSSDERTNIDLVNMICERLDQKYPIPTGGSYKDQIKFVEDRKGHDFRYAIDWSKIKNELGWEPQRPMESGLTLTMKWYDRGI